MNSKHFKIFASVDLLEDVLVAVLKLELLALLHRELAHSLHELDDVILLLIVNPLENHSFIILLLEISNSFKGNRHLGFSVSVLSQEPPEGLLDFGLGLVQLKSLISELVTLREPLDVEPEEVEFSPDHLPLLDDLRVEDIPQL